MKSRTTEHFWKCYASVSASVKKRARQAYQLFKNEPYHASLRFKRVHPIRPIFSVRITKSYRAVGIQQNGEIIWFWIGSHSEYEKLIKRLKA